MTPGDWREDEDGGIEVAIFQQPQPAGRTLYVTPTEAKRLGDGAAPHLKPLLIFFAVHSGAGCCRSARARLARSILWELGYLDKGNPRRRPLGWQFDRWVCTRPEQVRQQRPLFTAGRQHIPGWRRKLEHQLWLQPAGAGDDVAERCRQQQHLDQRIQVLRRHHERRTQSLHLSCTT